MKQTRGRKISSPFCEPIKSSTWERGRRGQGKGRTGSTAGLKEQPRVPDVVGSWGAPCPPCSWDGSEAALPGPRRGCAAQALSTPPVSCSGIEDLQLPRGTAPMPHVVPEQPHTTYPAPLPNSPVPKCSPSPGVPKYPRPAGSWAQPLLEPALLREDSSQAPKWDVLRPARCRDRQPGRDCFHVPPLSTPAVLGVFLKARDLTSYVRFLFCTMAQVQCLPMPSHPQGTAT